MKVCIDIQAAVAQSAGVGRYVNQMVRHLAAALPRGAELVLFYFDFLRRARTPSVSHAVLRPWRLAPGCILQQLWKRGMGPPFDRLAGRADVYHLPNFILPPLRRGRSVVTIHDLSFIRLPDTTEEKNLQYLTARIRDTVSRADLIVTDSEFTAREAAELLKVKSEHLSVVYPGIATRFFPQEEPQVARMRLLLSLARPYILAVGTIEPRKNHAFLIEIFERLEDFDGDLVIVGRKGWKCMPILERIRDSSRREHIRWLARIDDHLLTALYSGAELLVFPSLYEGFGFPPLEALACGCPVVASAAASLAEILGRPGSPAMLVDGFDRDHWIGIVRKALADREWRQLSAIRGPDYARQYRWEDAARAMWDNYRSLV
ncbi:MAG TPA: glycosyltransferase family 1 protein [Kiritimatiellae bacterium]|nr:glycosyltransferase family 1 protein [Kiritimatiellia bacterium]